MNCDDAFNALTDPVLRHGRPLQMHLARCPRCRNMQAVLEPALDLFGHAANEFDGDVPADSGGAPQGMFLTAEAIRLAEQTAADLAAVNPQRSSWKRRQTIKAAGYAAVACLGVCLAFGLSAASRHRDGAGDLVDPIPVSRCIRNDVIAQAVEESPQEDSPARTAVMACVTCHLHDSSIHAAQ